MTDHSRLAALARAATEGDQRALTDLLRQVQPSVWRLCRALGSPTDPDDLTQEALLAFVRALPRWRGDGSVLAYALVIARRTCADNVRRRNRHRRLATRIESERPTESHTDNHRHDVLDLLGMVDDDRREAFVLTQIVGLSYDEAATVVGVPVGTIRSRVARARADLMTAHRNIDAV